MTERQYRARENEAVRLWRSDWSYRRAQWNAVRDQVYVGPNFFRLQGLFESERELDPCRMLTRDGLEIITWRSGDSNFVGVSVEVDGKRGAELYKTRTGGVRLWEDQTISYRP